MRILSAVFFLRFLAGKLKKFEQINMENFFRKKLYLMEKIENTKRVVFSEKEISYDSSLQAIMKLKILLPMKFVFYLKLNLGKGISCFISVDTSIKGIQESAWK